jgi:hypothetical protein
MTITHKVNERARRDTDSSACIGGSTAVFKFINPKEAQR